VHVQESLKHAQSFGVPDSVLAPIKQAYATGGRAAVVRHVLAQLPGSAPPMQLAIFSAEIGDLDAAFVHLNRAIDSRDPCLVHMAVAPQWTTFEAIRDSRHASREWDFPDTDACRAMRSHPLPRARMIFLLASRPRDLIALL
jgi:hypothetical protein